MVDVVAAAEDSFLVTLARGMVREYDKETSLLAFCLAPMITCAGNGATIQQGNEWFATSLVPTQEDRRDLSACRVVPMMTCTAGGNGKCLTIPDFSREYEQYIALNHCVQDSSEQFYACLDHKL